MERVYRVQYEAEVRIFGDHAKFDVDVLMIDGKRFYPCLRFSGDGGTMSDAKISQLWMEIQELDVDVSLEDEIEEDE